MGGNAILKLLFVQAGTGIKFDTNGNAYVNSNDDKLMWKRYRSYCDELKLLLKKDDNIYSESEAMARFMLFNQDIASIASIPDIYTPRKNLLNLKMRFEVREMIAEGVRNADKVIVRSCGFWPSTVAVDMCRKYNKPYLIEVIEFGYDMLSYTRFMRLFAPYAEFKCRREIARAPYVLYVSQNALQERYPTSGKSLGCSDVEIPEFAPSLLEKRLNTAPVHGSSKIIFGTAAAICKLKGQEYIVRALAELRKQGINNLEYHLAGDNPRNTLHNLVHQLHLEDCVKFFGAIAHDKIFDWYDHLDVYIQPSFTESFGRSVVEAMSRALPAACACVGGMKEYASKDLFFQPGNVSQICSVMKKLLDQEVRKREAVYSFTKAQEFAKSRLDPIRDKFYMDFINGN